jgi:type II secretory pathway component PulM
MNERIAAMTHTASAALGRLSPRERRLILAFTALATAALLYLIVLEPIIDGRARMEQRITALTRDLDAMSTLAARIRKLESELGRDTGTGRVSDGFSLFSFMDRATSASVSADAVASMNPSRRKLPEGLLENVVELRLQNVPLAEVVALLRQIETATEPVYVKRLELKRRYDDHARFDANLIAGALSVQ